VEDICGEQGCISFKERVKMSVICEELKCEEDVEAVGY